MINNKKIAIWCITTGGARLAYKIAADLADADLYISAGLQSQIKANHCNAIFFNLLSQSVAECFNQYKGHIFIMSTGIVIRIIAPLIQHKIKDPAIVVADEKGLHAISLLSGHIGGANELSLHVAAITGADPVITTATDINEIPAIDVLAKKKGLIIENPETIKKVSMAFLSGQKILLHDPDRYLTDELSGSNLILNGIDSNSDKTIMKKNEISPVTQGVWIDYTTIDIPAHFLKLRPVILSIGIGCNRNTSKQELKTFFSEVLNLFNLSVRSVLNLASINLKADEKGLLELAADLDLPIKFYSKKELEHVQEIKTPSLMVKKHIGVTSVCEAAAILAAENGKLIVHKQIKGNVTIAIAKRFSIS